MGVSTLTFTLHALVTLQTQMIQSTRIFLCLEGHIVRLSPWIDFVNYNSKSSILLYFKAVAEAHVRIYTITFSMIQLLWPIYLSRMRIKGGACWEIPKALMRLRQQLRHVLICYLFPWIALRLDDSAITEFFILVTMNIITLLGLGLLLQLSFFSYLESL